MARPAAGPDHQVLPFARRRSGPESATDHHTTVLSELWCDVFIISCPICNETRPFQNSLICRFFQCYWFHRLGNQIKKIQTDCGLVQCLFTVYGGFLVTPPWIPLLLRPFLLLNPEVWRWWRLARLAVLFARYFLHFLDESSLLSWIHFAQLTTPGKVCRCCR